MMLYLRLAWRNVWRHRRRTLIIVSAMGFGLSLMMMYDGLVDGFNQAIYGNAIKVLGGNIQVHAQGYRESAGQKPLLPLAGGPAECVVFLSQTFQAGNKLPDFRFQPVQGFSHRGRSSRNCHMPGLHSRTGCCSR